MMILLFFIGGFLTSFFVCLIERRSQRKNWWSDRSKCNYCGEVLRTLDLIPVINYIYLRGRSRCCHQPIPKRYFLFEVLGGLIVIFLGLKYGDGNQLVHYLIVFMGLYYLSLEDLNSKTLNMLDYWVVLIIIIGSSMLFHIPLYWFSGIFLFLILYVIYIMFPNGIGEGDAWVGFIIGLCCSSIWNAYMAFTLAFVMGAITGIWIRIQGGSLKDELPFIPCLALSAYLTVLIF